MTRSDGAAIAAIDVDKTYHSVRGDVQALAGVSFSIEAGEFVSVVGPSGCGKSTLMRCVAGLEIVTAGTMRVFGNQVSDPLPDAGIVFQRDVLLDWRRVLDNVLLPAELRHPRSKGWEPRAIELLNTMGLQDFARRYPWELSGGMRQRVA